MSDVTSCKKECETLALTADKDVESGRVSQKCYDLSIDLFSCLAALSCSQGRANAIPEECKGVATDIQGSCR